MKILVLTLLTFGLCSCEIFGWDSVGGNNGETPKTEVDSGTANSFFYLDVPMGYPNQGSAPVRETGGGSEIIIAGLDENTRSGILISPEDALKITQAACDETATTILNVDRQPTETIIEWENQAMSMGTLAVSREALSDPPLQVISCIN